MARKEAKTEFAKFREQVTTDLIAAMEAGTAPWQKPWAENSSMPFNAVGKNKYRGGNAMYLALDMMVNGFADPRYLTIAQAAKLGEKDRGEPYVLRDGQRDEFRTVEFWKAKGRKADVGDKSEPEEKPALEEESKKKSSFPLIWRAYKVYHVSQFDGIPELEKRELTWSPIERAEQILQASGADIREGGNRAAYSPTEDRIVMPTRAQFDDPERFYSTSFHELSHWTGAGSRTGRHKTLGITDETDSPTFKFGDDNYAKEELVAELSSVFLCAEVGIPHDPSSHAAYLDHWISILKEDRNALFRAASDASRASDFILQLEIDREQGVQHEENVPSVAAMVEALAPSIVTETEPAVDPGLARAQRVADALSGHEGFTDAQQAALIAEAGYEAGTWRATSEAADILLESPYVVSWDGGTRWNLRADEAFYNLISSSLNERQTQVAAGADVAADEPIATAADVSDEVDNVNLDATASEKRISNFMAKLNERDRSSAELWSLAMHEIRGLKDELSMTTVRSELTAYRKAVAAVDPEHPILDYLRPSRADQSLVAEQARERALGDLRTSLTVLPATEFRELTEKLLKSDDYFEKMAGLMAATGRRSTELAKTGSLELIGENGFTDVAWGVTDDKGEPPYGFRPIPVVVEPTLVKAAFDATRKERDFTSAETRDVNSALATRVGNVVKREFATIGLEITPKELRPMYAAYAFAEHGRGKLIVDYQADILQHDRNNPTTAFNNLKYVSSVVPPEEMYEQLVASHEVMTERTLERLANAQTEMARVNIDRELKHLGWLDVKTLMPEDPALATETREAPPGQSHVAAQPAAPIAVEPAAIVIEEHEAKFAAAYESVATEMRGWGYAVTSSKLGQTTGEVIKELDGHVVQDVGRNTVRIVPIDAFDTPPHVGERVTIVQDRESGRCTAQSPAAEQEVEIAR